MHPVIICGGSGTKLWPMSRNAHPKHFLPLIDGESLFQLNWKALRQGFSPKEIYLQTNARQAEIAKMQIPKIVDENIFIEPESRNQGPATGFAAAKLFHIAPDEPFMLVQADVLRSPTEKFLQMMEACDKLARTTNKYITGGFKPTEPLPGVDYLLPGELVSSQSGVSVYAVDEFIWRAPAQEIERHLKRGALVHANHTCQTPRNILEIFKEYQPLWHEPLVDIISGKDPFEAYAQMPAGPLEDITQKMHADGRTLIVRLPFDWFDFGTWDSVIKYFQNNHLALESTKIEIESQGNFVRSDNRQVALVGVDNLIVIDTADALLICHKDKSGDVGKIVEELKKNNKVELL